jgi:hypothetical protein
VPTAIGSSVGQVADVAVWLVLGLGGVMATSVSAGLALGAALGRISRATADLFEDEAWATRAPAQRY